MSLSKLGFRFLSALAFLLAVTLTASAQYRGSIQGVVTDPQGAVVTGAKVTLTNLETNQVFTATSDDSGIFNFTALPPSRFSLAVEKQGFKKKILDSVQIISEQANAINVPLDVGDVSQSVTVNAEELPAIDTESGALSGTVTHQDIQRLPSFGRDAFQLLQLAPGAFGDGSQGAAGGTQNLPSTTVGGTGGTDGIFKIENGGQISAGGARTADNNYQIDGVGTTSVTWGGTSVVTPNEDSIKEVKIVTDNYDAENGRYRGAQVQIISQNGTNQYHGSFFFKAHRPGLDAKTKYNGYNNGNVRDANRFNDWGGTAGGPILHNRLFAFFSYERLDNNAASGTVSGWYETSAFAALAGSGTNAGKFLSFPGSGPNGGTQVDKACSDIGLLEGTNCRFIAGQGLNLGTPLTAPLGTRDAGYTSNTNPGTGGDGKGGANNLGTTADIAFFQNILNPSNSNHVQYNGRLDFNATSRDLVAFSMYYVPNSSTSINGNGTRLMNRFNSTYTNRAATLLWDHTFGSTLVNEARLNAAGWMNKDLASNPNAPWGLPQVSFNATGNLSGGNPIQGFGIGSFNGFDQWTYAGKDVLTKIHGAHTMKMGGEFTRLLSVDAPFWSDRPSYSFNNIWDFLNDAPVTENAQFDPKSGVPSALRKDLRNNLIGLFFQDNYKVRSNLTLTAGLRWDYYGPISEKNGLLATVVLGSGANLLSDLRVRTGGDQFHAQKGNFGPQLGFAWSPSEFAGHEFGTRLVFRGGFGMAYNGISQSNTLDVRFNPPFVYNNTTLSGAQLLYINSFPSNVHNPNGYAANPSAITTFNANNLPTTGRIDLTALPDTWPTTYTYHYTLGADYDLGHQWVASVGYQGSTTRHLTEHYNLYNVASAHNIMLNPAVSGVTYYADDGSARFNALLLELKHSFGHSFMLDTQYRLSHSLDSGSNAYAGGSYQWDLATGFATSDYDTRHAFKLYGVWSPTIFKGHDWREKIVGGWSLSGILNAHSGFPWTPQYGNNEVTNGYDPVFNFGQFSGGSSNDAGSGAIWPTAYHGGYITTFSTYRNSSPNPNGGQAFFTPPNVPRGALFACLFPNPPVSSCPTGQVGFGGLPSTPIARNLFTGPGYFDIDATLSKSFGLPNLKLIGENGKIEFRANFFNLFNKLNLYNIQNDIMNTHFGQAQNALGARTVEMQARFSF
ncbi:MAG: carboxypeptidase regulatory-like domain-containing protein [Candidatus Acidiferrum sp.]